MAQSLIGGLLLLLATVAAIVWANVSITSYHALWQTTVMIGVGDVTLDLTLHTIVNDVLMAVSFVITALALRGEPNDQPARSDLHLADPRDRGVVTVRVRPDLRRCDRTGA